MDYARFLAHMARYRGELGKQRPSMAGLVADAVAMGLTDGTRPRDLVTREECAVAADFYPQVTGADIARCTRNMSWATWLLTWSSPLYRKAMAAVLRFAPQYTQLVMPEEPNPLCAHLDRELEGLYQDALALYPRLLEQITANLRHGTPLGPDFAPAFDIY